MSLENLCTIAPFLAKEKTWKSIFNTNSELSQDRTEKQIMPFKTIINWLFNDIACCLFVACFDCKIGFFQLCGFIFLTNIFIFLVKKPLKPSVFLYFKWNMFCITSIKITKQYLVRIFSAVFLWNVRPKLFFMLSVFIIWIRTSFNPANIYLFKVNNRDRKKVCNDAVQVSLLLNLNIFHAFLVLLLLKLITSMFSPKTNNYLTSTPFVPNASFLYHWKHQKTRG